MIYTEIMQETSDIDWFAIDRSGHIAHFASAGGVLPESVAASIEDNEILTSFFRNLPVVNDQVVINDLAMNNIEFTSEEAKRPYLKDFIFMARRGLYSFDKKVETNFLHTIFHIITAPLSPLRLQDLPDDIQQLISKTRIEDELSRMSEIDVTRIS